MTYRLTMAGDVLTVQADRPVRVIANYRLADEGGIYLGESVGSNVYRLPARVGTALRRWAANPKAGTFTVSVGCGGPERVAVPASELMAAVVT